MGIIGKVMTTLALLADFYLLSVFIAVMIAIQKDIRHRGLSYGNDKTEVDK
jgi:hypothetical protein